MKDSALGRRVRALRAARGLRQEDLAELAGTTQAVVSNIETKADYEPGAFTLAAIARALEVSVEDLLSGTTRPEAASGKESPSRVPPGPIADALATLQREIDQIRRHTGMEATPKTRRAKRRSA